MKIEATRAAHEKEINDLAEAEAKVAKQRMFLGAAASMVEEKKFGELLKGKAREANAKQTVVKTEQKVWERTMQGQTRQRISNVKKAARIEQERDENEKRVLAKKKKEITEREYLETQDKKAKAKNIKTWEQSHSDYLRTINPFATRHNDDMIATITQQRKEPSQTVCSTQRRRKNRNMKGSNSLPEV